MSKQKSKEQREKDEQRRMRFWKFIVPFVDSYVKRIFDFSPDDFDPAGIDGPVLVAINHSNAYDPLMTGTVFKNKPLTFVASEHILRMRPWGPYLDRYCSIIPHQKGARGNRTALAAIKRMRRGGSVFLAPEGEQTWDGRPMPVMPQTGGLAKASGATLVTYVLEGAYYSYPRWALYTRKGKIYGHPVNIYTPEKLAEMSDEEVDAAIAQDLAFDSIEWQKSQPGGPLCFRPSKGGNADGLERSVFTCPECGRMDSLRSKGDTISCSCGFSLRLQATGFFKQPSPFESPADWNDFDRKTLEKVLSGKPAEKGETEVFGDDKIRLLRVIEGHSDEEAAFGRLSLSTDGKGEYKLRIGDRSFGLKQITGMTMILAGRIVFSDANGYYEMRSGKKSRANLRKYVIAWELTKDRTDTAGD